MAEKMVLNFMTDTEWVTLTTEDGEEIECEILKRFDVYGDMYAAIRPAEASDIVESGTFLCRYIEEEDGSFVLENIDDEEELQAVGEIYEQVMNEPEDMDDFDDEEEDY